MHKLHIGYLRNPNGSLWQRAQPITVFRRQLVARPQSSHSGNGIEVVEISQAGYSFIVIAADKKLA